MRLECSLKEPITGLETYWCEVDDYLIDLEKQLVNKFKGAGFDTGVSKEAEASAKLYGLILTSAGLVDSRISNFLSGVKDAMTYIKNMQTNVTDTELTDIWRILTAGCKVNTNTSEDGYRTVDFADNSYGFDAKYIPEAMATWLNMYNSETNKKLIDRVLYAAWLAYLFTRISPFSEANERMSIIIIYMYLYKHGLTGIMNVSISEVLIDNTGEYQDVLNPCICCTNCTDYIRFMLNVLLEA